MALVHVYLSGPIIHESLRQDAFYSLFVTKLTSRGFSVFAPQFLGPAEPAEIYVRDVLNVRKCNVLIAEVSNPSLGVGMEIMLAIELKKPVLLFRNKDAIRLSKMVLGAHGKVLFEYETLDDVERIIHDIDFGHLHIQTCSKCDSHIVEAFDSTTRCILCGHVDDEE